MGAVDKIKGITIELDCDCTKLNNALKSSEDQIRSNASKLKDIDKLLKLDPGNTELLTQKFNSLQKEIKGAEDKLKTLKEVQSQMVSEGKIGTEEYDKLQREIVETEQKVKSLTKEMKEFGSVSAQKIGAAGEKVKDFGGKVEGAGRALMPVSAALTAAGTIGVEKFAEVDKTMTLANKTMGNTSEQADLLNQAMKNAAMNSTFGMSEAAQAALNFARAGLTAEEAAAALAPAMNLAAGEGGNLDTVSAGLIGTMRGFGASFDETSHYADVFAAACNNSSLDIDSLSAGISDAVAVFATAGYTVEDLTMAVGIMGNKNIEASVASTSLKTGIARLATPAKQGAMALDQLGFSSGNATESQEKLTKAQYKLEEKTATLNAKQIKYNEVLAKYGEGSSQAANAQAALIKAQNDYEQASSTVNMLQEAINGNMSSYGELLVNNEGEMRPFNEVLGMLHDSFAGLSEQEQIQAASAIFGKNQMANWLALINASPDEVDELTNSISNCEGTTQEMADAMMGGFGGSLEKLKSSIDVAAESFGEALAPSIEKIADAIQKAVDWFNSLDGEQQTAIANAALVVAALGPLLVTFGKLITAFGTIMTWAPKLVGGFSSIGSGISGAFSTISGAASTAWSAVSSAFSSLGSVLSGAASSIGTFFTADLGATMSAGGTAAVGTAGAAIAGSVVAFFGGAEIGKKMGGYLFPDDADLYEHYSGISGTLQLLKDTAVTIGEEISYGLQDAWGAAKEAGQEFAERTSEHFENFKTSVSGAIDNVKEAAGTFVDKVKERWEDLKEAVLTLVENVKTHFENFKQSLQSAKDKAQEIVDGIKERFENLKQNVQAVIDNVKGKIDDLKQKFEDAKTNITNAIDKIKSVIDSFKQKFDDIKAHISGVVDWLKGCFNFEWKLPDLKLPHFSIDGSLSLDPPSVPKLKVDWYAKAMDRGMILNSPTIFGAAGNKLLGGGEAGSEAVVGTASLQQMITGAVAAAGSYGDIVIPVNIGSKRIETIVVEAQQIANYKSGGR